MYIHTYMIICSIRPEPLSPCSQGFTQERGESTMTSKIRKIRHSQASPASPNMMQQKHTNWHWPSLY